MRPRFHLWLWLVLAPLATAPGSARARRTEDFAYPKRWVWAAAVRLLRVDLNAPIEEKDAEDGYFLFTYPHGGRNYSGSVEVVAREGQERSSTRVVIHVAELPAYVERMMLSRLARKLEADYGAPNREPKREPDADTPAEAPPTAPQPPRSAEEPSSMAPDPSLRRRTSEVVAWWQRVGRHVGRPAADARGPTTTTGLWRGLAG